MTRDGCEPVYIEFLQMSNTREVEDKPIRGQDKETMVFTDRWSLLK